MINQLFALLKVFGYLSLLTVGGGMAAFPELKTLTVDVHHWLTSTQLIHLYSVGQMAPGPNMMMVVSIGERVAGSLGALVVFMAFFLPTAVLTFAVGRLWNRLEGWPWRDAIQRGLAPVAIGLFMAGSITMGKGVITDILALGGVAVWTAVAIAVSVFVTLIVTHRINPTFLILGGALIGLFAFGSG
jgi:chromate transporter